MIKTVLAGFLEDFVALIFPRYCLACYHSLLKGEDLICTPCMLEMPHTLSHLDEHNPLQQRLVIRIPIAHAFAIFRFSKSSKVQKLLHELKYRQQPEVGTSLGRMYGEKLAAVGFERAWDLIVPIPLHPSRLRKRGYNQSQKFAEGLSEKLGIPVLPDLVRRMHRTETQTRKSKRHRWENVNTVFELCRPEEIKGRKILLVDDVITTGATIEACATILLKGGCRELSIACIAEA